MTAAAVSAFVRLLGSGILREAGRHLLIAIVAVELALSLLGPVADDEGRVAAALTLLVVLVAAAVLGLRAAERARSATRQPRPAGSVASRARCVPTAVSQGRRTPYSPEYGECGV